MQSGDDAASRAVAVVDEAIPPLLSLRAAADVLGCSRTHVRTRCSRYGVEPIELDSHHRAYVEADIQAVAELRSPTRPVVPPLFTPTAAAAVLGVNFNSIARALRAGDLPGREVRTSSGMAVVAAVRAEIIDVLDQLAKGIGPQKMQTSIDPAHWPGIQATAELIARFR